MIGIWLNGCCWRFGSLFMRILFCVFMLNVWLRNVFRLGSGLVIWMC